MAISPSAKTNYTHINLQLYKTEVIVTAYKFPLQAPASPAKFSRPICKPTQFLQHPEHAVAVVVIMSHGVAVAVVAPCGVTVAVAVPRSSHRVVVAAAVVVLCVWGVVVVVVTPCCVVMRSWLLSLGQVVPQSQSSWSRRRHTSSPSCYCRGRWLGRGRPWRERTVARPSAMEVEGGRALRSEVKKRKKNYVHICSAASA